MFGQQVFVLQDHDHCTAAPVFKSILEGLGVCSNVLMLQRQSYIQGGEISRKVVLAIC
jgi:hypothetical protein